MKAREEILAKLKENRGKSIPIIGAGAGSGISAKFEEEGGIDLIVIYNSGKFRMAGRGSLAGLMPYGDANQIVMDMGNEILTIIQDTPVLAGVCGTDPFRKMNTFLKSVQDMGFSGVQNFPTVGLCDGLFRKNLEETGMSYDLEVEMIHSAHELGLLTTPYAFNKEEAKKMTEAGADIVVAHMGLTTRGSIGASTALSLDESVSRVQEIADEVKKINSEAFVLCHGGPISMPEDAQFIFDRTKGVDGFYGASSIERLPTEIAIRDQVRRFKTIRIS